MDCHAGPARERAGFLKNILIGARRNGVDTAESTAEAQEGADRTLIIVGCPNVGKSVLFNRLTGRYVVVSNYPGTTVEVSQGHAQIGRHRYRVVDTPGMYSLRPISEEERVARQLILREHADVVVHVADARNLDRMLPFTLQLAEAGLPVILVVNMIDEAERSHLSVNTAALSDRLGLPVVPTSALTGRGMDDLRSTIDAYANA